MTLSKLYIVEELSQQDYKLCDRRSLYTNLSCERSSRQESSAASETTAETTAESTAAQSTASFSQVGSSSVHTDARTPRRRRMEQFAVSSIHRNLVEEHRPGIEAQFHVTVRLSSYADPEARAAPGPGAAVGPVDQPDSVGPLSMIGGLSPGISDDGLSSAQIWVDIEGDAFGMTDDAKQCILALCQGPDVHVVRMEENLSPGFGDHLENKLDEIQSKTRSRIERIPGTDTLVIFGDATSVACARSLIDEECNKLRKWPQDFSLEPPEGRVEIESIQRNSPKGSEYTTDDSSRSHRNTGSPAIITHNLQYLRTPLPKILSDDASTPERTIEERRSPRLIPHSVSVPAFATTRSPEPHVLDNRTLGIINSMQKLGYSREQVDHVLQRLGPAADHNDVLGALVNQRPCKTDLEYIEGGEREVTERPRDICDGFEAIENEEDESSNLRTIIVDGSNVAMSFGNKDVFACKGIEIVTDWFYKRGHRKIIIFVPTWRKEASKPETPITDQEILNDLEKRNFLVWTPSRRINGRRIVCYDDRYIIKTAVDEDGIIVSNDNFRDIQNERSDWKKVIAERLLMYSFVNNRFMPPDDPLGRHGPSLDNFLRMKPTAPDHLPQACPYGKKCTYGNKCKYFHADRPNRPMKSISETLKEQDKNRKEKAKLNPSRSKYTSISSAPIPGYVPPEDVSTTPEWHTTPLPGQNAQSSALNRGRRLTSESSALPTSPKLSGSPHHVYESEQRSQSPYSSPRDDVFRAQDFQQYHHGTPSTPPSGHIPYTSPLTNFPQHSPTLSPRDLHTVPLQRYPSPNRLQLDESLARRKTSLPTVKFGSGETLGTSGTSSAVGFERRSSQNDLLSDFPRMAIHESSGEMLPRDFQQSYSYGNQLPQSHGHPHQSPPRPNQPHSSPPHPAQFHPGHSFPNQPHMGHPFSTQQHPNQQIYQGGSPSPVYHNNDSFGAARMMQNQDQILYDPRAYKQPVGYPSPSRDASPKPYYTEPAQASSDWPTPQPLTPSPRAREQDEQRRHIFDNLASRFGPERVKAVMQRHPHELNPSKLIMFMQTNM